MNITTKPSGPRELLRKDQAWPRDIEGKAHCVQSILLCPNTATSATHCTVDVSCRIQYQPPSSTRTGCAALAGWLSLRLACPEPCTQAVRLFMATENKETQPTAQPPVPTPTLGS